MSTAQGIAPELFQPQQLEAVAKEAFFKFLNSFGADAAADDAGSQAQSMYAQAVQRMRQEDTTTLYVDWQHFMEYNNEIAEHVAVQYYRLEPSLRKALQNFVRQIAPEMLQVRGSSWGAAQGLSPGLLVGPSADFNFRGPRPGCRRRRARRRSSTCPFTTCLTATS